MPPLYTHHPYLTVGLTALLINIPLGFFREPTRKFSVPWFVLIHASIPLIVYLRIQLHTPPVLIPLWIGLALAGQIAGARIRRRFQPCLQTPSA